jgi:alpha-tubulin suppressor-like RCC1 family protein
VSVANARVQRVIDTYVALGLSFAVALGGCGARSGLELRDDAASLGSSGSTAARGGAAATAGSSTGASGTAISEGGRSAGGSAGTAPAAGRGGFGGFGGGAGNSDTGGEPGEGGSGGEPVVWPPLAEQVALGFSHSCARFDDGSVRCWGSRLYIGTGSAESIGDDEPASVAGDLAIGGKVVQLAGSWGHSCARLDTGKIRCWGLGSKGRLGYGNEETIGDDETPASAGDVNVGGTVTHLTTARNHTCASIDDGSLRCWGSNTWWQLGLPGREEPIGDDETPAEVPPIDVGGFVLQVASGNAHACALLAGGKVRCWGAGEVSLGYGNTETIGDDETPAAAGDVDLGGKAVQIVAGFAHSCALLDSGKVRCWGIANKGALGYGNTEDIGDDETPADAGDVDVGGSVTRIAAGQFATCALLTAGAVRCWGENEDGQLGYGHLMRIGDDETPAEAGDIDVGGLVADIHPGLWHTCAALQNGKVRCWGRAWAGQLGYGNDETIGDDETPASAGDVPTH